MVSPEVKSEYSLDPQEIVDRLSSIESMTDSLPLRAISGHVKGSLSGLEKKYMPTAEDKMQIAMAARNALSTLTGLGKELDPSVALYRYGYAKMDILAGLGEVEDVFAQFVITEGLDDPQEQVRKVARDLLTRTNIKIFSNTFNFLFRSLDPKDPKKPDQEKIELALSIIEHNKSAGYDNKSAELVDPAVKDTLLNVLSGRMIIDGGKHRAAVIASKLYDRALSDREEIQMFERGDLFEKTRSYLLAEVTEEVESMKSKDKFDEIVRAICQSNLLSAKTADDIYKMDLILPQELEAVSIWLKMHPGSNPNNFDELNTHKQIRALASQEARMKLEYAINRGREEEKKKAEEGKAAEVRIMEEKRKKRESDLDAQRSEHDARIKDEKRLAMNAVRDFPGLVHSDGEEYL